MKPLLIYGLTRRPLGAYLGLGFGGSLKPLRYRDFRTRSQYV